MPKLLHTAALACAITLLACCQLNDKDSAPRAPELSQEDREESIDPATFGAGSGSRGDGDDPSTVDAGVAAGPEQVPTATSDAALPMPTTFPGLEAGTATPVLPVLPGLEAGTISPPNPGS